ncbi:MAG: arginine--tRNA ligase [Candidatus Latescibacteria bacterium]|nr:arginine--tRNA ligase [Candidatus Latescibacterota bacterium]
MNPFIKEITDLLAPLTDLSAKEIVPLLEIPPDEKMGDYAFPCFTLANRFRKAPAAIAQELVGRIGEGTLITEVRHAGPYINFVVDRAELTRHVLTRILEEGERCGESREGEGKTVVADYSSPNIARPFTIAHLRSTAIGHSICKTYEALGYRVVRVNHLGDWGTQFGKLITAYQHWGDREKLTEEPVLEMFDLYVRFHREAEEHTELEDEAREWFRRLEKGDGEARSIWEWFREESLREFNRLYETLGVTFDSYAGESFYNGMVDDLIEEAVSKGVAVEGEEGALIVDLSMYDMPPCILRKKDGSSIYATRDLCAAKYRYETYHFDRMVYTTDAGQSLHFRQVFKVLDLLGYEWASRCVHVPFGVLSFREGRMSTRRGNVIFLEDVLNRAVEMTRQIIEGKNPDLEEKDQVARDVGIGAVIHADLSIRRMKNVIFDWDEILNFDGDTGPYIQYTYARLCSILRKYGREIPTACDVGLLTDELELAVVRHLDRFPGKIKGAAEACEPSMIAGYLSDLVTAVNRFYNACRVIGEDESLTGARIALVAAARTVIGKGLALLGMKTPERM